MWITSNARNPEAFDVLAYDTTTFEHRVLFQNPGGFSPVEVSRDGAWLALQKANTSADSDVYLVDLRGEGEPALITPGDAPVSTSVYGFTPDSKTLVFATDAHGEFNQAWTHDLATDAQAPLIEADWDVMYVAWSPSGRYRVSAVNADASTALTIIDTRDGRPLALEGLPAGDIGSVRFSPDESRIAFTVLSDTSPADVFVADLADRQARRLTTALNPAIDRSHLVEASIVRYTAEGGVQIPSVLYRPKGARRRTRCRRSCWCMAGRAARPGAATARWSSTSSTTATPCSGRTTAAPRATARPSSTWTTVGTARPTCGTSWPAATGCARRTGWPTTRWR